MPVVICPSSYDRVEGFDESILCPGPRFLHRSPDLIGDRFYRLPGWLDEQFSVVFPEVVPRKSNPSSIWVIAVFSADSSRPHSARKLPDDVTSLFHYLLHRSGDQKVVRIADKVDFHLGEFYCEYALDSIQRHVSEDGRDGTSLRRAPACREEVSLKDAGMKKPLQIWRASARIGRLSLASDGYAAFSFRTTYPACFRSWIISS